MEPSAWVVAVLLTGYAVGLPALVWGLRDMDKIPGGIWRHAAERPRHQWRVGMIGTYLLGGWPVIVAAVAWRRSRERSELYVEWALLRERKRASRRRNAAPEPVISTEGYDATASQQLGRADA